MKKIYIKINIKKIIFPYSIKGVGLINFASDKSTYPINPSSTFCSIMPIGFITAEIPLLADLIIYLPLSIALKIL